MYFGNAGYNVAKDLWSENFDYGDYGLGDASVFYVPFFANISWIAAPVTPTT